MDVKIVLDESHTVGLLPQAAYSKIEETLTTKYEGREYDLEVYCKMMLVATRTAEAQLSQLHRRAKMYKKMFTVWQPHIRKLRKKQQE